jgi:preprotein translocase subunit YajC
LGSLIIIAAMFALLWLLLIRPQRTAAQQRERLTQDVDVGDEILSSGGLFGTVRGVSEDDEQLFVEIAPGVEVRMDRRAVGAIVSSEESEEEDTDDADLVDDESDTEPDEITEAAAEHEPAVRGTIDGDRS